MIPKIIHYCWFGPKEMPAYQKEYVEEWKKLMPDYEFKCWNEKELDVMSIPFTKGAYEAKKYAYVADYTRIYALYNEGGIYMDTDVMLRVRFDDFLKYGVFTSFEYAPKREQIQTVKSMLNEDGTRKVKELKRIPGTGLFSALIGGEKHHPFFKDNLDYYNSHSFEEVWGGHLTVPNILAYHAEKYGMKYTNKEQHIDENIAIYDNTVFASFLHANKHSLAIHYVEGSWSNKSFKNKLKKRLYRNPIVRKCINFFFPKEDI